VQWQPFFLFFPHAQQLTKNFSRRKCLSESCILALLFVLFFFRVEERLGKNAFAFTSFFRFCSFVVTSFVNHVIPSVYVLIINVHAVILDFLDYNVKMQCICYDFFYFNMTQIYRFYNYCNLSK